MTNRVEISSGVTFKVDITGFLDFARNDKNL
jgi:hypothetical protein